MEPATANEDSVVTSQADQDKFSWIVRSGRKGICPRCGEGHMFKSWLKVADQCAHCGLDYRFASPDDGPAFFSLCIVAFPLTFLVVWLQVAFNPPIWVHFITSLPLMVIGCVAPLQPIKGWLIASQYVNRAQEAGTQKLWAKLHGVETLNSFDG
jgi:uncharacterized protein (DUF983 family)